MTSTIRTEELSKRFLRLVALDHINLDIPQGAVYATVVHNNFAPGHGYQAQAGWSVQHNGSSATDHAMQFVAGAGGMLGTIDIAGYRMSKSQKYRNIAHNNKVAFVVDDITSRDPWRVRCLEIRGTADQAEAPPSRGAAGDELDTAIIRVTPRLIISFGIDDQVSEPN